MKQANRLGQRFFTAVAMLGVLLGFSAAAAANEEAHPPAHLKTDNSALAAEVKQASSLAPTIKGVAPSVVNVFTTKMIRLPQNHPFLEDPMFRRFFGLPDDEGQSGRSPQVRPQQGLGSGVIVTEDGYILTNNHVVEGADEIQVGLSDGKTEYEARVIGRDSLTDLAVLKVDATNLPAITIADSDKLEVGDMVLAIGNPLGVGQTVTRGIVSAVGRFGFGITRYEDFIQTDAAINPGNSGGALVDAQGRLVGINTLIFSRSGGSQGIGFAVPIKLAQPVLESIVREGKVTRGYLGVELELEVTADHVKAFELPDDQGALVTKVSENGPAEAAGLKQGDFIVEFNGKKVIDRRALQFLVAQTPPQSKVSVKVLRDSKERTFSVVLGELDIAALGQVDSPSGVDDNLLEGVSLADLDQAARRQFSVPDSVEGVLVTEVDPESAAYDKGLRPGSVILEINKRSVRSVSEATSALRRAEGRVLLRVRGTNNVVRFIVIDVEKR